MTINQKEAVYVATMNYLAEQGISFDDGQTPSAKDVLGSDGRKAVISLVTQGFVVGEVTMSDASKEKYQTEESIRKYSSELVANWLKKDTRLNGGEKHTAKNPGSKAGSGDEVIRELKKLRQLQADDAEAVTMIEDAIKARQAEIAPAKVISIDTSKLPASLLHLVK